MHLYNEITEKQAYQFALKMAKFGDVTKTNLEYNINEAQPHPKRISRYVFLVKAI